MRTASSMKVRSASLWSSRMIIVLSMAGCGALAGSPCVEGCRVGATGPSRPPRTRAEASLSIHPPARAQEQQQIWTEHCCGPSGAPPDQAPAPRLASPSPSLLSSPPPDHGRHARPQGATPRQRARPWHTRLDRSPPYRAARPARLTASLSLRPTLTSSRPVNSRPASQRPSTSSAGATSSTVSRMELSSSSLAARRSTRRRTSCASRSPFSSCVWPCLPRAASTDSLGPSQLSLPTTQQLLVPHRLRAARLGPHPRCVRSLDLSLLLRHPLTRRCSLQRRTARPRATR